MDRAAKTAALEIGEHVPPGRGSGDTPTIATERGRKSRAIGAARVGLSAVTAIRSEAVLDFGKHDLAAWRRVGSGHMASPSQ